MIECGTVSFHKKKRDGEIYHVLGVNMVKCTAGQRNIVHVMMQEEKLCRDMLMQAGQARNATPTAHQVQCNEETWTTHSDLNRNF